MSNLGIALLLFLLLSVGLFLFIQVRVLKVPMKNVFWAANSRTKTAEPSDDHAQSEQDQFSDFKVDLEVALSGLLEAAGKIGVPSKTDRRKVKAERLRTR